MSGPPPKSPEKRLRRNQPARGEWRAAEGVGWQHGPIPTAPDGLMDASIEAWTTWMAAWFAAHWGPEDLPGLLIVIHLYDQVERGEFQRASELRLWMAGFGISPQGQQDRRWTPPQGPAKERKPVAKSGRYDHLSLVDNISAMARDAPVRCARRRVGVIAQGSRHVDAGGLVGGLLGWERGWRVAFCRGIG